MEMSQHSQSPAIAVLDKASERQRRMDQTLLSNANASGASPEIPRNDVEADH